MVEPKNLRSLIAAASRSTIFINIKSDLIFGVGLGLGPGPGGDARIGAMTLTAGGIPSCQWEERNDF